MTDLVPCFTAPKGYPTTHFDMDAVEAIGLVKIDILAQGGLAVMRDTFAMVNTRCRGASLKRRRSPKMLSTALQRSAATTPTPYPPGFPRPDDDMNDPAVWEMIAGGGARAVHHIESPAMISLCRMTNVREIDGLIAIVSVIRPGAANEGKKRLFTRRYQGLEPVRYPHPSLARCLRSTFGLVVYEEHILQVCDAFAGLAPGRADLLRRALNKEQWDVVETIGKEFVAAARARGRDAAAIAAVWKQVCGFGGYAFCKAHSTAYGVEAYQSAWLKKYHPAEFMAAVLTNGKGFYRPIVYVLECHRLGIPLRPPSVNEPGPGFKVIRRRARNAAAIIVPATRVKGLREKTCDRMITERDWHGPFRSIADFAGRVGASREELERLMRVGAFDEFGAGRPQQFWEIQRAAKSDDGRQRGMDILRLENDFAVALPFTRSRQPGVGNSRTAASPPSLIPPSSLDRLQAEMDLLDFPVSGHPLELYPDIAWETYVPVARLAEHLGETVTTCGLIVQDRTHCQVTGELMKFMTIADRTGMVETDLFADTYRAYGLATVRYPVLEITARVEPYENGNGYSLRVLRAGKPRHRRRRRG